MQKMADHIVKMTGLGLFFVIVPWKNTAKIR